MGRIYKLGLLCVLAVLAACSDQSVTSVNVHPEAAITVPESGFEIAEGEDLPVRGQVSDHRTDPRDLQVSWSSSLDGQLLEDVPDSEGITEGALPGLSTGEHIITLRVIDPDGASETDTVTVRVLANAVPSISIDAPVQEGVYYSDLPLTLRATVGDVEDAPTDLRVDWTLQDGTVLVDGLVPDANGETTAGASVDQGTYILIAGVTDSVGQRVTDTVTVVVGPPNTLPTCGISTPEMGTSVPAGELVVFEGTVADVDVPADWLSVRFESNIDGLLGMVSPSSSGDFAFATAALSPSTHTITMTATDEVGGTCSDFTLITVSTPPSAEILLPLSGEMVNAVDTVSFQGEAHDDEEPDSSLSVTWTSDLSGLLGSGNPDSSGSVALNVSGLSVGTHLVTLTVQNSSGLTGTDTVTLQVNSVPTAPVVDLNPTSASTLDDLTVSISVGSTDTDGPSAVSYSYSWTLDGNPQPGYNGLTTLPASATSAGDLWEVQVVASDGFASSTAGVASRSIENSAPSITSVTVTPTIDVASAVFTAQPAGWTDVDGDAPGYLYQWYAGGIPIPGETSASLVPLGQPDGAVLSCLVTPFDGQQSGSPVSSSTALINTAPTAPVVSIAPVQPGSLDDLTVSIDVPSSDPDGGPAPVSYNYAWSMNGNPQPAWNGAATVPSSATSTGEQWSVGVTSNDGLQDSATASAMVAIVNSPPSVASASVSPTIGLASTSFLVTPAGWSDPDGDPEGYLYQWHAGTSPVSGATSDAYVPVGQPAGTTIWVEVTPWDGAAGIPVIASAVINTPPVVSGVSITPAVATEATLLTATYSGTSDADGQPVTLTWQWFESGNIIPGATGLALDGNSFDRLDVITVRATPHDGLEPGSAVESAAVTIQNSPPVTTAPSITNAPLGTNTSATCGGAVPSDLDGDGVAITYTWAVNGVDTGLTGTILPSSSFVAGDIVVCAAIPFDGLDTGTLVASAPVVVGNTAPSAPTVLVDPSYPMPDDTLSCMVHSAASDPDGDPLTYDIAWFRDGFPTSFGQTGTSLTAVVTVPDSATLGGETWTCQINANDGLIDGPVAVGTLRIDPCLSLDFDGSGDVVTVSDLDVGAGGAYTLEAWVFWEDTSLGDEEVVFSQADGATERFRAGVVAQDTGLPCSGDPGSLYFTNGGSCVVSSIAMAQGFWHHVAWTSNGTTVVLYLDGQEVGDGAVPITGAATDVFSIGGAGALDGLSGGVDEVRVSSMRRYASSFVPEVRFEDDISTSGLWHFDEGIGPVAGDDSSYGVDGDIYGADWDSGSVCDADPCDIDGDGAESPNCGGVDCNDSDPLFGPLASDSMGDGVDHNCDGIDCEGAFVDGAYFNLCAADVGWYDAQNECIAAGYLDLASITTATQQAGVEALASSLTPPYDHFWIGLNDQSVEGTFVWADGDPFGWDNWLPGEPNSGTLAEDCVHMWRMGSPTTAGYWNDNECHLQNSYICGY